MQSAVMHVELMEFCVGGLRYRRFCDVGLQILRIHIYTSITYMHVYMKLSSTREATSRAAGRELPSILWDLKVHYSIHQSSPSCCQTPSVCAPTSVSRDQVSHTYITQAKLHFLYILIFGFVDSRREDKMFCTESYQAYRKSVSSYMLTESHLHLCKI
jgi:hypothetical protein